MGLPKRLFEKKNRKKEEERTRRVDGMLGCVLRVGPGKFIRKVACITVSKQLFQDNDDGGGREDLNFLESPSSLPPSSIYAALFIFNELSPSLSSHAGDFLRSSLAPVPCFPPSFHLIHFCCCIDDDDDGDKRGHN